MAQKAISLSRGCLLCLTICLTWDSLSEALRVEDEAAAGLASVDGFTAAHGQMSLRERLPEGPKRVQAVSHKVVELDYNLGEGGSGIAKTRQLAFQKKTAQSSTEFGATSDRAVDGNTDNRFKHGSCTHTHVQESPWWRVDMGDDKTVNEVQIYNRGDITSQLSDFEVRVGDSTKWQGGEKCGNKWNIPKGENMKIDCTGKQGRYLFVVIPNGQRALSLCEVKVTGSDPFGSNAAQGKPVAQSSTVNGAAATRAVDGKTNTMFSGGSCTQTKEEMEPWWRVDLEKAMTVSTVQLWNRGDCCGERLSNAEVRVGMNKGDWTQNHACGTKFSVKQGSMKSIACGLQRGRYVFVVIRGRQTLTLCEVRVQTVDPKQGKSIARGKPAKQSSTALGGVASRAVDGNIDTDFAQGSCTATHFDNEPWWRVDLETKREIGGVQIWNRGDCCGSRLSNFEVRVGMSEDWRKLKQCGLKHSVPQGRRSTISCNGIEGRYVYIVKAGSRSYLNLCEVRVIPFDALKQGGSGCTSAALGMEDRKIPDAAITASSTIDPQRNQPFNARLNYRGNSWTALYKKEGEWLEIELTKPATITGITTQGSALAAQWVTGYMVKYKVGSEWKWYDQKRKLGGNTDQSREQKNVLKKPFDASAVRIYPQSWQGAISLRVELLGHRCKTNKEVASKEDHERQQEPRCETAGDVMKCVPARQTKLTIKSFPGYGEGEANLWYAQDKGDEQSKIMGKSMYVDDGVDFRTQKGSIYSSKDLVANRFVRIGAWPGYGTGQAQLRYSEKPQSSEDEEKSNSLYVDNANFHVREGSIHADQVIRAGKYLEIKARTGFGEGVAQLWYSAVLNQEHKADTLYLKKGNFATEQGDIVSAKDVSVGEYLEINAFPKFGSGKAKFWYVGAGKDDFQSNSVYLQNGDFRTQTGDIYAKKDLHAGRYLVLESKGEYGLGAAKLWYAKNNKNGLGPNTIYVDEADFSVDGGSISASKDVSCGRFLKINAYPGFGSGAAEIFYSQVGSNDLKPNSLYLKKGDIRTQTGSIYASQDIHAERYLAVNALAGHGEGAAKLWFSSSAKGKYAEKSLYLKEGDFRTEDGSIVAGQDIVAQRYLSVNALPGFGSGQADLWFSNAEKDGYKFNSLYLKSGDFRTEKGSIVASKDVIASEYLKIKSFPGYGEGETKLWYSQEGKEKFRSNSLYLAKGDFRTEQGSIYAAKEIHVGRYLEVQAWPGHGSGNAQLWHGRKEQDATMTSTLYLKEGSFQTQKGSIIAHKDMSAGRYVKIGASPGFGSGSAQLWYSGTGRGAFTSETLFLEKGDFETLTGGIRADVDITAGRNLKGKKLKVEFAHVTQAISAGHLFLGKNPQEEAMMDTTELLDITTKETHVDVGAAMHQLDGQLKTLSDTNDELRSHLNALLGRLSDLEKR